MAPATDVGTGIREALAARLKRDVAAIKPADDLRNDLGLDSLDMIELLFKIEEVFELEIPNEDLVKIATVGDVTAYVERRLAEKAAAPPKPAGGVPQAAGVARKPAAMKPTARAAVASMPASAAVARTAPVATAAPARGASARRVPARRAPARAKPAPRRTAAKKKGS